MRLQKGPAAGFSLAILGLLVFSGCVSRKEIVQFKDSLRTVENQTQNLEERSARLDSLLTEYTLTLKSLRAESSQRSDDLDQRMNNIEARLEDLLSLYSQSYNRSNRNDKASIPADAGRTDSVSLVQVDAKQLYDAAYLDLTRGNYSLAITGFSNYLKNFPDTPLSDNALYWIGECYYLQAQYDKAITQFQKLLKDYPTGDKVASSLYKTGLSYLELKDRKMADEHFKKVMDEYPRSPEAKLAKDKLKS